MDGGETQPVDKVREEDNPLVGFWGRDNLSSRWETMCGLLGQIPGLPKFLDILLLDSGGLIRLQRIYNL